MLTKLGSKEMNLVWRFYVGADSKWRWQKLSAGGTVIADCNVGYPTHRRALLDAQKMAISSNPLLPKCSIGPACLRSDGRYSSENKAIRRSRCCLLHHRRRGSSRDIGCVAGAIPPCGKNSSERQC
jgi:hypothetical protein